MGSENWQAEDRRAKDAPILLQVIRKKYALPKIHTYIIQLDLCSHRKQRMILAVMAPPCKLKGRIPQIYLIVDLTSLKVIFTPYGIILFNGYRDKRASR